MKEHPGINTDLRRHPPGRATNLGQGLVRLTFEREYAHPLQRLWQAVTDPAETATWWARSRGSLQPGSSFDLQWLNARDEENGTDMEWWTGTVLTVDPPHVFEISNEMHGSIRFELTAARVGGAAHSTRLIFTNTISAPEAMVARSLAGWHTHLDHLQEALEGKPVPWPRWWAEIYPSWETIHADYLKRRRLAPSQRDHVG